MRRIRKVRKFGNSWVISLYKFDILDFGIEEGSLVDISDIVVLNGNKKESRNNKSKEDKGNKENEQ
ncbi:MAG: hypothetical protein KatS3mg096_693 [Candidatus Parcubacteria bacterium]|nr:MAG: hypothetical protein KatS3mg096_666 [Candidatus Parcubacteria bacterium]GIW67825.1 MAG: hypothetical protein KatS3mg096_693 [Candidatus Parcubacteria bacterium]